MNEAENDTPGLVRLSDGLGPLVERLRLMSRRGHWPLLGDEAAAEIERAWAARDAAVADLEAHAESEARRAVAAERKRWATAARLVVEATPEQLPLALDALADVLRA